MRDKIMPHDERLEQAALGACLIDPEQAIPALIEILPAGEAFYLQRHRWIYTALRRLHDRRESVDFLTLTTLLEQQGHLDAVGGPAYLADLSRRVPSAFRVHEYARALRDLYRRRELLLFAENIAKRAYDEGVDLVEALTASERELHALTAENHGCVLEMPAVAGLTWDAFEGDNVIICRTGFSDLDALIGGWRAEALTIIAARPGVGKTSLLLNFAQLASTQGKRTLLFSLEMGHVPLCARLLTSLGITPEEARDLRIADERWPVLTDALGIASEYQITIDDTPGLTVEEIRAKATQLHSRRGLDLIIVDYLQLMSGGPRGRDGNREQEVAHITRGLKNLARELDVQVIAASQLNRAVEQRQNKTPVLSDLRESGAIEQDADVVIFPHRDTEMSPTPQAPILRAQLIVSKNRHGATGNVPVGWYPERFAFVPVKRTGIYQ